MRRAEAAAQAAGYFEILAPRYRQERGAADLRSRAGGLRGARARARAPGARTSAPRASGSIAALQGFTAAPFGPGEAARLAQQLLRFLALVPVEYGRGVSDGRVTKDFEIQEAVTFRDGAQAAFTDLQSEIAKRDAGRAALAATGLAELKVALDRAVRTPRDVAGLGRASKAATERTDAALRAAMPSAWLEETDESDYDLIALTLDRMEASAGAGQYRQAEQARLEAYAFFEFGPERRLKSFDPGHGDRHRGLDLVRRRRHGRAREADRRPRAAARDPQDARGARRAAWPTPRRRSATAPARRP